MRVLGCMAVSWGCMATQPYWLLYGYFRRCIPTTGTVFHDPGAFVVRMGKLGCMRARAWGRFAFQKPVRPRGGYSHAVLPSERLLARQVRRLGHPDAKVRAICQQRTRLA